MSYQIWVTVSWSVVNNSTSGTTYRGTGQAFDTGTKLIAPHTSDYYAATLDPAPTGYTVPVGQELYNECSTDGTFTKTTWVYDGGTATHTTTEVNSPTCGYTPPLTCDLGTVTVSQQLLPSGARVTVQLGGTSNGPAAYTLDGGAEQYSPSFPQVAPGQHQVRVRDSNLAGCERLITFTVAAPPTVPTEPAAPTGPPQGIDFVGQPLFFALPVQAPGAAVELELWAERAHYRGDFARVVTLRKRADAQGRVSFRLDPLLLPLLSAWQPPQGVPVLGQVSQPCTPNLVNYYVRTKSVSPAAGALPDYQVSGLRVALRGGLAAEWQGSDFFASRLAADQPGFLSWQPTGAGVQAEGQPKAVVPRQPEWLFWLCPAELAGQQLRVRRTYRMSPTADGVSDFEPLATPTGGWGLRLLAIPLQDARAGFASLGIRVETLGGQPLSAEAWFEFIDVGPRTRFLLFTNSLGGVDTLRCEGKLEATLEATVDAIERPVLAPAGPGAAPLAERRAGPVAAGRKLRLTTGVLSPAELSWAQELVLARELWQQVGPQLRPLEWAKRSLAYFSDEPLPRGLTLEFDYAYDPTAYVPTSLYA